MTLPGRNGVPTVQRDTTEVLIEVLGELRGLSAAVQALSKEVAALASANAALHSFLDRPETPSEEVPETWVEKARRFVTSPEAAALAGQRKLTIAVVAEQAGIKDAPHGQRKHIGKLLMEAGYSRVICTGGQACYRRVG